MRSLLVAAAAAVAFVGSVRAIPDGLGLTPMMGVNSWTSFGSGVTAADLIGMGQYLSTSGLAAVGYTTVCSDDGWSNYTRGADGRLQADSTKFPQGFGAVCSALKALGLKCGIYTAESSVVCSGRPGSLFNEQLDAETFLSYGITLLKNDNCGEYTYGDTRFQVMADAFASLGGGVVISTEPFDLIPGPSHASFAHYWRTGNDIDANWGTILDRIDRNDKWAVFARPGGFSDPDMLQVGNGGLSDSECRAHFGLWAITKSPLILGSDIRKLTPTQLAIIGNKDVIAVNQDPLGIQARKVAINGAMTHRFVGVAPCSLAAASPRVDGLPGPNGVTAATLSWTVQPLGTINGSAAFQLVNNATGRCLATMFYVDHVIPVLMPCVDPSVDPTQAWTWPSGAGRIGGLQNLAAVAAAAAGTNPTNATVLAVGNSTLYGTVHGNDPMPLLDAAYGIQYLTLVPWAPEPFCNNRNCQNYDPSQTWYYSPSQKTLALAHAPANMYRCFEGPCYQLTSHLPASEQYCLSQVASVSNDGVDPHTASSDGTDVYAGPLSGGAYAFGLLNRNAVSMSPVNITAQFSWLEVPGMSSSTTACARELFTNTPLGVVTGSVTFTVASHDFAMLRVVPGATSC